MIPCVFLKPEQLTSPPVVRPRLDDGANSGDEPPAQRLRTQEGDVAQQQAMVAQLESDAYRAMRYLNIVQRPFYELESVFKDVEGGGDVVYSYRYAIQNDDGVGPVGHYVDRAGAIYETRLLGRTPGDRLPEGVYETLWEMGINPEQPRAFYGASHQNSTPEDVAEDSDTVEVSDESSSAPEVDDAQRQRVEGLRTTAQLNADTVSTLRSVLFDARGPRPRVASELDDERRLRMQKTANDLLGEAHQPLYHAYDYRLGVTDTYAGHCFYYRGHKLTNTQVAAMRHGDLIAWFRRVVLIACQNARLGINAGESEWHGNGADGSLRSDLLEADSEMACSLVESVLGHLKTWDSTGTFDPMPIESVPTVGMTPGAASALWSMASLAIYTGWMKPLTGGVVPYDPSDDMYNVSSVVLDMASKLHLRIPTSPSASALILRVNELKVFSDTVTHKPSDVEDKGAQSTPVSTLFKTIALACDAVVSAHLHRALTGRGQRSGVARTEFPMPDNYAPDPDVEMAWARV